MNDLYMVRGVTSRGDNTDVYITNKDNLDKTISYVKDLDVHNLDVCKVYVNRSKFCFDGYLVSSDYVGSF